MSRSWAWAWLHKNGFTLRRATTSTHSLSMDPIRVNNQKLRLAAAMAEHGLCDEVGRRFIFNADESGYVTTSAPKMTFEKKGTKDVLINGKSEREQFTVFDCISMDGAMLPRQVIFPGKTDKMHPADVLPNIHYSHSQSHWATSNTLKEWLEKVFVPHVKRLRSTIRGKEEQVALLLLDAYRIHFDVSFVRAAALENIRIIPIEANYTSVLQPCDDKSGPNRNLKPLTYRYLEMAYLDGIVKQNRDEVRGSAAHANIANALEKFDEFRFNINLTDVGSSATVIDKQ
jgi:hypothetical protein